VDARPAGIRPVRTCVGVDELKPRAYEQDRLRLRRKPPPPWYQHSIGVSAMPLPCSENFAARAGRRTEMRTVARPQEARQKAEAEVVDDCLRSRLTKAHLCDAPEERLPVDRRKDCAPLAILQCRLVTAPRPEASGTTP
jgi:hypothetical protein